ncbi:MULTISPECIES: tripartite tricarboxylate transporter substrate binding protein [unclassified Achromobacter]|uniref:Bug family tripartite tricarboxylate transporter substrate binding protein n=1 Tax=unclassified Achromobacter TaxID=2626865 RepID=UPI000B515B9B|nr:MULTISPECIES: tripartite tricarboxylate transporter substrate binding protein [unclassified Achromobacter]OWT80878.1 hypothetical protein CEY05_05785 [Achromobacter sp. HZ34]OWT81394.1 hypothetical protein CEY04_05775 [Achromobacter sp. HZ28]
MDQGRSELGLYAVAARTIPTAAIRTNIWVGAYPNHPITLLIGQPPGDGADIIARHLSGLMGEALGQRVIVANRPGAVGDTAAASVTSVKPDGYTLFLAARPVTLHRRLVQPIKRGFFRDLVPVGLVANVPYVLVMGCHVIGACLMDAIALANEYPDKLVCGSGGVGSTTQLLCETLRERARMPWTSRPYGAETPALMDVIAGRIEFAIVSAPSVLPYVEAGKVRILAVFSRNRVGAMPSIPSVAEYKFMDADAQGWLAIMAPRGTPPHAIDRLNRTINAVLSHLDIRIKLTDAGYVMPPSENTPETLETFLDQDARKWIATMDARQIGLIH